MNVTAAISIAIMVWVSMQSIVIVVAGEIRNQFMFLVS